MNRLWMVFICALTTVQVLSGYENKAADMQPVKTRGVRVGVTHIHTLTNEPGTDLKDALKRNGITPMITQFGYQMDKVWDAGDGGTGAVTELMLLAGGLEQGVFIPSATWLMGVRIGNMLQLGGGPNISLTKNKGGLLELYPSFVWGIGGIVKAGDIRFPMDVALASNRGSVRTTFLTGFIF